jgi:small subunit ribosomal protein S21
LTPAGVPVTFIGRFLHTVECRIGRSTNLAVVNLHDGESIEGALRRFKRQVMTQGIIRDVKKHSFYLKPGEKKRLKSALARKRARKTFRRSY